MPTCPGWSIGDLTKHLGTVHRWAERLVRVRAPQRIASGEMGLGKPRPTAEWLRSGGEVLVETLAPPTRRLPCGPGEPTSAVRFWSRRQLHETLVHRLDVELALGRAPAAPPAVAADAIDEFLVNLSDAAYFSPG